MVPPTIDLSDFADNSFDHGNGLNPYDQHHGGPRTHSGPESSSGMSFGKILSNIRSDLDREQFRIRNKIHDTRYRRDENQDIQEEVRRIVEEEHQNLIARLQYLEGQLAESETESSRLRDEVARMRKSRKSSRGGTGPVTSSSQHATRRRRTAATTRTATRRSNRVIIVDDTAPATMSPITHGSVSSPISLSAYT